MPLYVLAVALVWPLAMTPADAIAMDVYGDVARSVVGVILTALLVWRGYAGMRERLFAQRTNPEVDHFDETESEHAPNTFLARHVRKVLAGSGFVMLGYVVVHMAGNLLAFGGPAVFNGYAHGLRELGTPLIPESGLLWLVRVVLTGALALHLAVQVSGASLPRSSATTSRSSPSESCTQLSFLVTLTRTPSSH